MVLAFLVAAPAAWATDYYWAGAGTGGNTATDPADPTTQWAGAANWQEGSAPDALGVVHISLANAGSVYAATTSIESLYVGGTSMAGAFCIADGIVLTENTAVIGGTGAGVIGQTGGTHTVNGTLCIGDSLAGAGTYNISSGTLNANSDEYLGYSSAGTFTQTGGTHTVIGSLYLGYGYVSGVGGVGNYSFSSGTLNVQSNEFIGYSISGTGTNTGTFTQTGGTHMVNGALGLGVGFGTSGTYNLSLGELNVRSYECIGSLGSGMFTQTGGTHTVGGVMYLGQAAIGIYTLSAGALNAQSDEYIGYYGTGTFTQTGGTHTVTGELCLGYGAFSSGTYVLQGAGVLSASDLYVGQVAVYFNQSAIGSLTQGGGASRINAGYLDVGPSGRYDFSAGSLQVTGGGLRLEGPLDFHGGSATISVTDGIVDLQGSVLNGENAALTITGNSLAILPTGFDPLLAFHTYSNSGMTHIVGTPLLIEAGQTVTGTGAIGDPVAVSGSLAARANGAGITLMNGITVAVGANADLGAGTLTVNDLESGMAGGQLSESSAIIGSGAVGQFTQTGGTHTVGSLNLGQGSTGSGTYSLSSGNLKSVSDYIGDTGAGSFTQTSGTHTVVALYLGYWPSGSGTYELSSGELNVADVEYVGWGCAGTFTQTGGTHTVGGAMYLGNGGAVSGTYSLSSGDLKAQSDEHIGYWGTGTFDQTGGTHTVNGCLYLGSSPEVGQDGGSGTYNLSSGALDVQSDEYIGYSTTGSFTQTGGTHTVKGSLTVGGGPQFGDASPYIS